ncbi:MAG: YkgJ family cysteine cluster protein [Firmicutes bacterium]|nr:YkgJ family cysteine cluster protein [Bacillota bacterium]
MLITPQTVFVFRRNYLLVSTPLENGIREVREAKILYNYYPAIQESTACFTEMIAEKYSLSAFGHLCTQCGNCCRQENILVQGADIFRIAHELGVSIEKFRKRYLKPAGTWNEYDGYLKLKKGKCPFLKQNPSGCYSCTIYKYRPQSCRMFQSMSQHCRKDPGFMIQYLDEIVMQGDDMRISIISPSSDNPGIMKTHVFNYKLEDENLRRILAEISKNAESVEGESIDLIAGAVKKAEEILGRFIENFAREAKGEKFAERMSMLRDIVKDLDEITSREPDDCPPLDEVWKKMRTIEALAKGENSHSANGVKSGDEEIPLYLKENLEINSITVYPEIITVNFRLNGFLTPYPIHLSSSSGIMGRVRDFVKSLVMLEGDQHQLTLTETDPICYLCGDCCAQFGVEIQPSDIRQFADNMNLPIGEVKEKYLEQHRYSWNRADGCMKKHKLPGEDQLKCVLLEKRDNGYYYCSVHSYKPDVCKQFTPNHILCRKVNNIPHWHRLPGNIIRIDLSGNKLHLHTNYTHKSKPDGSVIYWRDEAVLSDAVLKLAEEIAASVSGTGGKSKSKEPAALS